MKSIQISNSGMPMTPLESEDERIARIERVASEAYAKYYRKMARSNASIKAWQDSIAGRALQPLDFAGRVAWSVIESVMRAWPMVIVGALLGGFIIVTLANPAALHLSRHPSEQEIAAATEEWGASGSNSEKPCANDPPNPDGIEISCDGD